MRGIVRRRPYHYLVSLSRGNQRHQCEVWGVALPSPLPRIRVPLFGSDPDVVLNIQEVFRSVYEAGGMAREIDLFSAARDRVGQGQRRVDGGVYCGTPGPALRFLFSVPSYPCETRPPLTHIGIAPSASSRLNLGVAEVARLPFMIHLFRKSFTGIEMVVWGFLVAENFRAI